MKNNPFGTIGATGYVAAHLPPGAETESVMRLLRLGVAFDRRGGKSPGYLHRYLVDIVAQIQKPTFEKLLTALELEAVRRDQDGDSPVSRVSRSFEIIKFHDPKKGELEIPFGTLRNYFTSAKKENSREPLNGESRLKQCGHAVQLPGKN